jgi:ketosteroid isomerase-like protein
MASPRFDRAKAIRVLLDAAVSGDRTACKRAGIDERTLRRWRARLASDPELSAAFRTKNAHEDRNWKAARRQVLGKLIRAIGKRADDPETSMSELTGAARVLGELEITQGVLDGPGSDSEDAGPPEAGGRTPEGRAGGGQPGTLH